MLFEYPLSKDDLKSLHKGKLVLKNFSPPLQPHILICIVAWNRSILKNLDKRKFHKMRKGGIDVANIPLTNDNLRYIEEGNGVEVQFSKFKVMAAMEKTFAKAKAEKRGSVTR